MADDSEDGEVEDERALELSTVAAIYPELKFGKESNTIAAFISIAVEPIEPLLICFPIAEGAPPGLLPTPPDSTNEGANRTREEEGGHVDQDTQQLSHLPPIVLQIVLPRGYPAKEPPLFHLETELSWLPENESRTLEAAGHTLWEEMGRDQVVFSYIDVIREAAEKGFRSGASEKQVMELSSDLKVALLDFDSKAKRAKFEQETFECGICLEPKKGTMCHRLLLCSHVFCVPCLQDFYDACITEGDVDNVKCATPDCANARVDPNVSEGRSLEPSELLQIPLDQETVQRYIKLKRKKRLESDRNTIYCPRQWCQGPARCPNKKSPQNDPQNIGEEPQNYDLNASENRLPPPAERLAICEDCTFAFCKVCKASWHGEYFRCFPRSDFELTAEERASEDYLKLHSQACPTCDARAQKTHGCNHMICFKCKTHFCYLCGAYLHPGNPYQHYNTRQSGCYMRLWELEGGEGGEGGEAGGGGGGGANGLVDYDSEEEEEPPNGGLQRFPAPNQRLVVPAPRPPAAPLVLNDRPDLQRFLQLAQNDEEDGWDSDDMDDDVVFR